MSTPNERADVSGGEPKGIFKKRLDYYVHIDSALSKGEVRMRWPVDSAGQARHSRTWLGPLDMLHGDDVVLDSGDLPFPQVVGGLECVASAYGADFAAHTANVDLLLGGVAGGDLADMLNTPSIPTRPDGTALSFGFWDSGGDAYRWPTPLPAGDQIYAYLTRSYETWMGDLTAAEPWLRARPLGGFVVPGSHDAGMFDAAKINAMLASPAYVAIVGLVIELLGALVLIPVLGPLIAVLIASKLPPGELRRIMVNLAFTQKDSVKTQLGLGVRYFDFRPGYMHPVIRAVVPDDALYHQHLFVPGYPYKSFLVDVLQWLDAHPTEVVLIRTASWGFADAAMIPTAQTLQQYLQDAQKSSGAAVKVGTKDDLKTPYERLVDRSADRRLIFLDGVSAYDSYDDNAYKTTDPSTVLAKLKTMTAAGQAGNDCTTMQLQATSTNIPVVLAWGALATTNATCPLLSTKARFDHVLYPWVRNEVPGKGLNKNQLLVLLNDFADNALTSCAIELTRKRV